MIVEEARRGRNQLFLLFGLVLTVGTLGYYLIEEGWSLLDAFYMTVITITTIGFGEIHELSSGGRLFTVLLIVFGIGASAIFVTHFARLLLENAVKGVWGKRKMEKKIEKISGHFIICGYGRIGRAICAELQEREIPMVVIERGEEEAELAEQRQFPVMRGNATTDLVLLSAGIKRAAGIVSALSSDSDNLYISLTARELNPKLYIVVRSEREGAESRMHRAGADIVVSPPRLGGRQIAQMIAEQAGGPEGPAGPETLSSVLGYHLKVYRNVTASPIAVADALGETKALRALALQREDGTAAADPLPDDRLAPGESLVLLLHERTDSGPEVPSAEGEETGWDSSLSVGIMSIDEEHQLLLGLIQKLNLASRSSEREVISGVLNELIDYTVKHFRHEEELLQKYHYPDVEKHIWEHQELTDKVLAMQKEKRYLVKENFSALLREWLKHHIVETDRKYADFLAAQGVR